MSCCCCQGLDWCARFCCEALNRHKKSSFAGVEFSQVPLKEPFPVHNQKESLTSVFDSPARQGSSNLDLDRLQFSTHSRMNAPSGKIRITQQPSSKDVSKKLQLGPTKLYEIGDLHHDIVEFESPRMYREKAIDPQKDAMIQFSLHYDLSQSKLRVHLQYASNLLMEGNPEMCNPFVILHLEPDREDIFQSKVSKCTRDPVFNQTFQFEGMLIQYMKHQILVFRFYNHALNNKAIGKAHLQLCNMDLSGVVVQMKIIHTEKTEVLPSSKFACMTLLT